MGIKSSRFRDSPRKGVCTLPAYIPGCYIIDIMFQNGLLSYNYCKLVLYIARVLIFVSVIMGSISRPFPFPILSQVFPISLLPFPAPSLLSSVPGIYLYHTLFNNYYYFHFSNNLVTMLFCYLIGGIFSNKEGFQGSRWFFR